MSFILDALKKSENERQRQIGPSLADAPVAARRQDKPWWAFAVAALLVVNLVVLLIVLTRNGAAKPVAQPTQSTAPASPEATPAQPAQQYVAPPVATGAPQQPVPSLSSPATRSLADEAGGYAPSTMEPYDAGPAAAAAVPAGPSIVRPIEAPAVSPAAAYEPRSTQMGAVGGPTQPTEMLPTLNDLAVNGTSVPDLHLDIHVHSNKAAERFVFVNMRKYTEGQTLNEGPIIERITAEGVILNQRGMRFLLPRQ
jgi:general secretion pathway protein B